MAAYSVFLPIETEALVLSAAIARTVGEQAPISPSEGVKGALTAGENLAFARRHARRG